MIPKDNMTSSQKKNIQHHRSAICPESYKTNNALRTGHTLCTETEHPLQLTAGSLSWSPEHTADVSYLLLGKLFSVHLCSALFVHSTNKMLQEKSMLGSCWHTVKAYMEKQLSNFTFPEQVLVSFCLLILADNLPGLLPFGKVWMKTYQLACKSTCPG